MTPERTRVLNRRPPSERGFEAGNMKGQVMAEFAIVAPLFFRLTFAVFDYGRLYLLQMTLQDAVQQAGRFASTGDHLSDPNNPGQNLSRIASIIATAQQYAVGADISNIQISSIGGGTGSAGGPGDTVTVSLTSSIGLMTPMIGKYFPNGLYTFTSSVTFKNEPFSPTNTN